MLGAVLAFGTAGVKLTFGVNPPTVSTSSLWAVVKKLVVFIRRPPVASDVYRVIDRRREVKGWTYRSYAHGVCMVCKRIRCLEGMDYRGQVVTVECREVGVTPPK